MVESKFSTNVHLASWAVSHGVKSLPQWGATSGIWFLRQGGQCGARNLPLSGTTAGPYRRATRRQGLFFVFKTLLIF
jgi:hypothetical protein